MRNITEIFGRSIVKAATAISILTAGAVGCDRVEPQPVALPKLENADPHVQAKVEELVTEFARRCLENGQGADLSSLAKEKDAISPDMQRRVRMKCRAVSDYTDNVALVTMDGQTFSTRRSQGTKDAITQKGPIKSERIEWLRTVTE